MYYIGNLYETDFRNYDLITAGPTLYHNVPHFLYVPILPILNAATCHHLYNITWRNKY